LAGLSRSTFYYRQKVLSLCDRHAALKERIQTVFALHKGRYGYRRITAPSAGSDSASITRRSSA
jgi:putative transposase